MRVIAGSQKGRRLKEPTYAHLRPTSVRVREALFSILGERVTGAHVLDLYAGTGAIGIEALSRGAQHVVFVEPHPSSLRVLRENLRRCAYAQGATIVPCSASLFLRRRARSCAEPFEIVFADPPYTSTNLEHLLSLLDENVRVASQSMIILEHSCKATVPQETGRLTRIRQSRYGDTSLTFYEVSQ